MKNNDINEEYLQEIEINNKLFEEKLKHLNNLLSSNDSDSFMTKQKHKHITNSYPKFPTISKLEKEIFGTKDKEEEKYFTHKHISQKSNNLSDKNYITDNNMMLLDKNIELKKKIEKLEKKNNYKDYLINDFKKQIKEKEEKEKKSHINCKESNRLLKEIEDKKYLIEKYENIIKYLKLKIDNLTIDNKRLEKENKILNNKIEKITTESDTNKIDSLNYLQKINDLKLENKKLNIEFLNISNEYNLIKEEKEKLKSKIDELNTIIFNYQKQLSFKEINDNSNKYNFNTFKKYDADNIYKTFITKDNDSKEKYNYNYFPKRVKLSRNKYAKESNHFNRSVDEEYWGNKYNYYKNDYSDGTLDYLNEKNKEMKISEINYLENYLSCLLKERSKLESELDEINKYTKTLTDIKNKNNINDKISQNNIEIQNIKKKLKKLRGY